VSRDATSGKACRVRTPYPRARSPCGSVTPGPRPYGRPREERRRSLPGPIPPRRTGSAVPRPAAGGPPRGRSGDPPPRAQSRRTGPPGRARRPAWRSGRAGVPRAARARRCGRPPRVVPRSHAVAWRCSKRSRPWRVLLSVRLRNTMPARVATCRVSRATYPSLRAMYPPCSRVIRLCAGARTESRRRARTVA